VRRDGRGVVRARVAGEHLVIGQALVGLDAGAARQRVDGIDQPLRRDVREVGVAHPDAAILEAEAHRLDHHVERRRRAEAEAL